MIQQWNRVAVVVLSVLFFIGCKQEDAGSAVTKDQVEQTLSKGIHIGDTRNAVISFLDSNKIEHSGKHDNSVIYAIVRPDGNSQVVRKSLSIKFEFDAAGMLTTYSVTVKFTGT